MRISALKAAAFIGLAAALSASFNTDVIAGDGSTKWRTGDAPSLRFDGSDGGFVSFNGYDTDNSLQFIAGPVLLNSFDISSAHSGRGSGVSQATTAGRAYVLTL